MGRHLLSCQALEIEERVSEVLRQGPDWKELVRLAGDASTRTYFRLFFKDGTTAVVTAYPDPGTGTEAAFLDVQRFLDELGLPVPKILAHYPEQGLVILEDLGDDLLETLVRTSGEDRKVELYEQAVDLLLRVRRATFSLSSGCVALSLAFDEEKLMQEMDFFMTHFVRGFCRLEPSRAAASSLAEFFRRICTILAQEPRIFAHRDYHARNLILHGGRLVMIDFQDARMGPAQYDLASLLRDSYVSLPEALVDQLLSRYMEGTENTSSGFRERFRYVFDIMSLQRNIKALGTFGYQANVRGSRRYLSSVPRTGAYISLNVTKYEEFSGYRSAVEDFICAPAQQSLPI
jgi:N-acetylmuramate 1-kinase